MYGRIVFISNEKNVTTIKDVFYDYSLVFQKRYHIFAFEFLTFKINIMKKLLFAGLAVLALASCKKDWVCECQYSGDSTSYPITNRTKKDAKAMCTGSVSVGFVTVAGDNNCSLK